MQYSPKLKKAAEEIKEIFAKYDIAGTCVMHTPGFSEYLFVINPSYSCAWIQGDRLRVKALKKDFDTLEEWKQKTQDTVNMLHHLAKTTSQMAVNFVEASKVVDEKTGAEYFGSGDSSHISQNN